MNEFMDKINNKVESLNLIVSNLFKTMSGQKLPRSFKEQVDAYENNRNRYYQFINSGDQKSALSSISNLVTHSGALRRTLTNHITAEQTQLIDDIEKSGRDLKLQMESEIEDFEYSPTKQNTNKERSIDNGLPKHIINEIELLKEDHEKHDQRHQKLLADNLKRLNSIEDSSKEMQSLVAERLKSTNDVYDETIERSKEKEKNINELLGIVTNKKVAGKYEESAAEEKVFADWLRYASIACMIMIVIVVGYSFWETTTTDFKWENSIFRIVLAFLLTVPAAYLARESAKHREQQYNHLQTSLDLNAIDPYVASLLPEQQSKIKTDIAGRIFAAKDYSKISQDSYPLNTHEQLMELLKKVDFQTKNAASAKPEKG